MFLQPKYKLDLLDLAIGAIIIAFLLVQFAPLVITTRSIQAKQGNGTAITAAHEKLD